MLADPSDPALQDTLEEASKATVGPPMLATIAISVASQPAASVIVTV